MTDPLAAAWAPLPTLSERFQRGRGLRAAVPRRRLAELTTAGRDPLGILDRQNAARLPELVPLRVRRMSASPFTFYRGTAALMAADLARDVSTGIRVASCGDAHVSNFGFYASRQRRLMFDLNDFDESAWAPWEWDLKRLVASVVVAGQATSRKKKVVRRAAHTAVTTYARALAAAVRATPVDRYFAHFDVDAAARTLDGQSRKALRAAVDDARRRTGARASRRLTRLAAGGRREFIQAPPTMTHVEPELERRVFDHVRHYAESAAVDIRLLLQNYRIADTCRRVVGVGSVGTRCYLVLLQDGDGATLLLQAKQAGRSVLSEYGGVAQPPEATGYIERFGHGGRVVALQRMLQATSDPFLGHLRGEDGVDLYVRQFHDMKGGIETDTLDDGPFTIYAQACAAVLARAHAQSPEAATVAGYVGRGEALAEAILAWSYAYAELSRRDYEAFLAAHAPADADEGGTAPQTPPSATPAAAPTGAAKTGRAASSGRPAASRKKAAATSPTRGKAAAPEDPA